MRRRAWRQNTDISSISPNLVCCFVCCSSRNKGLNDNLRARQTIRQSSIVELLSNVCPPESLADSIREGPE